MARFCRKISGMKGEFKVLSLVCVRCIDRIRKNVLKDVNEISNCRKWCEEYYELARLIKTCEKTREEIKAEDFLEKLEEIFERYGVFEELRRADKRLERLKSLLKKGQK